MTEFNLNVAQSLVESNEKFPVDFDDAWQWLEYSRKDNAKTNLLKCGFVEEIDFRLLNLQETRPDGSFS
jgi:anti-repressor protein